MSEMSAILQHPVDAVNTPPVVPGLCSFGAVPVGHKFLYRAIVGEYCSGPARQSAVLAMRGSKVIPGTVEVLYNPAVSKIDYYVKLRNGCIADTSAAVNMRSPGVRAL